MKYTVTVKSKGRVEQDYIMCDDFQTAKNAYETAINAGRYELVVLYLSGHMDSVSRKWVEPKAKLIHDETDHSNDPIGGGLSEIINSLPSDYF